MRLFCNNIFENNIFGYWDVIKLIILRKPNYKLKGKHKQKGWEDENLNYKMKPPVIGFLGCVHRRNPYIRLELGFQNGRFSCDGSRFLCIISMHCIVNVENHQY